MTTIRRPLEVALLASVLATGCSIIAVRPDPTHLPSGKTVCASYVPPLLDAIATPFWAGWGYFLDNFCIDSQSPYCGKSLTHYIPAMVTAASALYGAWAVNRCIGKLEELPPDAAQPFPARSGTAVGRNRTGTDAGEVDR